ncbi:MAG: phenylalanine--tRNA ligase subunit alpha [Rhodospirillaceae bacterium]|nr:phenylalanine--tRNA ligase subunit alpha [Rhodospirillaceae bacterium]
MTTDNTDQLREELLAAVAGAKDAAALDEVRVTALGKKGRITGLMKDLGAMAPEARKVFGQKLNVLKDEIAAALDRRKQGFDAAALDARLGTESMDVTLPVRPEAKGTLHPISQTIEEVAAIFGVMGFEIADGPDIEDDFHNFTALNFPPGHPAREMHDTLFLDPAEDGQRYLLRTHTSPVQIRTMMNQKPPIRMIIPGRTYRCDYDMTHTPMFHQVELLVIDTETNMSHLRGCLQEFVRTYFGVEDLTTRFRPSYFPFTEPSAEMDIGCSRKGGELKIGNHGDWLEILGCGMVHPNVLKACGLDPDVYQGFAAGMGIERIAMLKYGIPDLRTFFESDVPWLKHYGFAALDIPSVTGGLTR